MSEKRVSKEELVVAPCTEACPAGIDVPHYIRCIKEGRFDDALAVIHERIPFAYVCGYACYAPCEEKCANQQFGDPIAIRALKRAAAEKGGDKWSKNQKIAPSTGKNVAVVGSGPSGLTAAYYLGTLGHKVTVLESLDQPGGMMWAGIPSYRLPRTAMESEINHIKEAGVEIKTGQRVASVDQLLQDGYDSVYIACGAHQGAKLGVSGDDLPGMVDGISFLRDMNQGKDVKIGDKVAIIGGGNTAVDSARSVVRLGAKEVTIVYRRSNAEMTAFGEEVGAAELEGVKIEYLTLPVKAEPKNGGLEVTFTRMELGKPDASGRPSPVPVEGSEFKMEVDNVIAAIGQQPVGTGSLGIALSKGDYVQADDTTLATDKEGVFAGGDIVTGPASIIEAIAHGRLAASSIDKYLGGIGSIDQSLAPGEKEVVVSDILVEKQVRQDMPCLPLADRTCGFDAVELGFSEDGAVTEAKRCLNCDARKFEVILYGEGCKECSYCAEVCKVEVFGPADGFNEKGYRPMEVKHEENCVGCKQCYYACPDFSIDIMEVA